MGPQVSWHPRAERDVDEIIEYVSRQSPQNATLLRERFAEAAESLVDFPLRGHVVEELADPSIREFPVSSFRLVYRVRRHEVEILLVFHGSRGFPALPR